MTKQQHKIDNKKYTTIYNKQVTQIIKQHHKYNRPQTTGTRNNNRKYKNHITQAKNLAINMIQ